MRMLLLVAMPSMDDVGIAPIQRGDQSRGVQIPRTGAVGGQSGVASTLTPSKGKGKVVRVVHSNDDVSLQRRMTAPGRGRSMVAPSLAATGSWPDSSAVAQATTLEGSDGSSVADDTAATTRATVEKDTTDAATAKKFVDDATAVKKTIVDAVAVKKAVDEASAKKKAIGETAAKKKAADDTAVAKKAASDVVTAGSGSSSTLSAGAKRVAAPSGSTPLAKR
jgi:hypothetical protein